MSERSGGAPGTRTGLWLAAVLGLALVLRLVRLGYADYWHDEVHGFVKAEYLWSVWTTGEFVSNHPPMFVSLLRLWQELGLTGNEFNARLLTVLLGLGGVYAVYFAGARLFGVRTGLLGAFFAALSPFLIHHAQDLKEYIQLPLFCTLTAWAIWRAAETNRRRDWAVYGVLACLSCYADLFAAPFLVGINLWFLAQLRGRTDRVPGWLTANVLGAAGFLPVVFVLLRRVDLVIINGPEVWIPHPGLREIVAFAKTIAYGYGAMDPAWKIAVVLWGALAAAGVVVAFRTNWRLGLLLVFWMILPVALAFAASHYRQSIFLYRGLIWVAAPVYLSGALAIARLPRLAWRAVPTAALTILAGLSLWQKVTYDYTPEELPHRPGIHPPLPYEEAATFIAANWREGDGVIQGSTSGWYPFWRYGLRGKPMVSAAPNRQRIDIDLASYPPTTQRAEWDDYFPHLPAEAVRDQKRIWFVFEDWERQWYAANVMPTWRYLDCRFAEIGHWSFDTLEIFLYDRDPAVRTVARISDNGAEAALLRAGAEEPYLKRMPDAGLVPTPVERRRGAITLAFADRPGAAIRIGSSAQTRTLSFAAENRSGAPIRARLMIVPSDAMVDAATLTPEDAPASYWFAGAAYNPAAPPTDHEMTVAVAHVQGGRRDAVSGPAPALPAGRYAAAVYYLGLPNRPATLNAPLSLTVGEVDLFGQVQAADSDSGWRWLDAGTVDFGDTAPLIRAEAAPLPGEAQAYANLGFIAFRRAEAGMPLSIYDAETALPPGETAWSAEIDADAARVDVFLLEYGEDGRAYRLYRRFDLE